MRLPGGRLACDATDPREGRGDGRPCPRKATVEVRDRYGAPDAAGGTLHYCGRHAHRAADRPACVVQREVRPLPDLLAVRLSEAQISALECREGGGLGPALGAAWEGRYLRFRLEDADALADDLNDASNGEDAQADASGDPRARRAGKSLAAVMLRVTKAALRRIPKILPD